MLGVERMDINELVAAVLCEGQRLSKRTIQQSLKELADRTLGRSLHWLRVPEAGIDEGAQ